MPPGAADLALARDLHRRATPAGAPLSFSRPLGPAILFTRDRNGVEDASTIEASWVLDDDGLVSCSFTDRAATLDPAKGRYGEAWWGMGPPDELRRLERRR